MAEILEPKNKQAIVAAGNRFLLRVSATGVASSLLQMNSSSAVNSSVTSSGSAGSGVDADKILLTPDRALNYTQNSSRDRARHFISILLAQKRSRVRLINYKGGSGRIL